MLKKLLSTSSLQATELAQRIARSETFYPPDAVFVLSIPKGSFPEIEAQYPSRFPFKVLSGSGEVLTNYLSKSYRDVFATLIVEKDKTPFYIH